MLEIFSFNGRIPRSKFWMHLLLIFVLYGIAMTILANSLNEPPNWMAAIPGVPFIWAYIAVQVKRFHDRDYNGVWVLVTLIPIVGSIWGLIVLGFLKGTDGANKYGENPLK